MNPERSLFDARRWSVLVADSARANRWSLRTHLADVGFSVVTAARRSSAEHLIATKALRCTATAWILTVAESFAKF